MGLKFSSFSIRGIDVSQYNGTIDWTKVSCNFAAIRVGYGKTIDTKFTTNWAGAKSVVNRIPYWYMDYYSNHNSSSSVYGTSDADWGAAQANTCWNAIKSDSSGIVFLDIESASSSVASSITTVSTRAQAIAKAFLQQMDTLNSKTNGIYCSVSMLSWFASWFQDRPLWVAWYNETKTIATVTSAVTSAGWTGTPLMWQYASDGDTDDDGVGNGTSMGMQYSSVDLNAWMATSTDYSNLFSTSSDSTDTTDDTTDDTDDTDDETSDDTDSTVLYTVKVIVTNLNIRSGPGTSYSRLRKATYGEEYDIYEEQNNFGRISASASEWFSLSSKYVETVDADSSDDEDATTTETALYTVKVLINNLSVRSGPGLLYTWLRRATYLAEYSIYEVQNNYGRISTSASEWINLSSNYVQKLDSKGLLSDAEKLARLWAAHPELH